MANPVSAITGAASTEVAKASPRGRLDQQQFMDLLMTQLKNQDPTKPLDSVQLFGQLAQFSTVAGVNDLKASFEQFAASMQSNQAMQAAGLVGKTVLAPGENGVLRGGSLAGTVTLATDTPRLDLGVYDSTGALVRSLNLGAQTAGTVQFSWDGLRDDGTLAPEGVYRVRAQASVNGTAAAAPTALWSRVQSVLLGQAGAEPAVELEGQGTVAFSKVSQIR